MLHIHLFLARYTAVWTENSMKSTAINPAILKRKEYLIAKAQAIEQKMGVSFNHNVSLRLVSSYFKYFG